MLKFFLNFYSSRYLKASLFHNLFVIFYDSLIGSRADTRHPADRIELGKYQNSIQVRQGELAMHRRINLAGEPLYKDWG